MRSYNVQSGGGGEAHTSLSFSPAQYSIMFLYVSSNISEDGQRRAQKAIHKKILFWRSALYSFDGSPGLNSLNASIGLC